MLPTGGSDRTRQANIGRNYLSLQPLGVLTWMDPSGFNGDVKATLNFNRTNSDTNYRSGREFIVDYAAGWGLGNGWVVGVGGYVYRQWSDDKVGGVSLAGSRGRSQSIGPSVRYANGKGWRWLRQGDDGTLLSTDVAGGFVGATLGPYARSETSE